MKIWYKGALLLLWDDMGIRSLTCHFIFPWHPQSKRKQSRVLLPQKTCSESSPCYATEQQLKAFRLIIALIVLADTLIKWCDVGRVLATIGKRTIVIICPLAFLVGFAHPLTPLVFEVFKRIGVQSYQLFPNYWQIFGTIAFLNLTQSLKLGINELFHLYSLKVKDIWTARVWLCAPQGSVSANWVACKVGDGWRKDIPEMNMTHQQRRDIQPCLPALGLLPLLFYLRRVLWVVPPCGRI